ncbi:MAG: radical SAM protein [Deltaproteobacteria bacterium]|nr:radical SAM protein [Deltaproteobacteria bacterium]
MRSGDVKGGVKIRCSALRGHKKIRKTSSGPIVTGWRAKAVIARLWGRVLRRAFSMFPPIRAIQTIRALLGELRSAWADRGGGFPLKLVWGAGRHFFHLNFPGFPSPAFDRFVRRELERMVRSRKPLPTLQTLILAITSRCPLSCRHCSEWKSLNRPDRLTREKLLQITKQFEACGVTQILLSGGEPMLRLDDILALCRAADSGTDYWIATSGHRLTAGAAAQLAEAGLTGVCISLDHFDPDRHDEFRGRRGNFRQAEQAARCVVEAGLVLCLNLCATREFVSRGNLESYAGLAARMGAGFIQVLDPRAVGRWEKRDVALSPEQIAFLDDFYLTMNSNSNRFHSPAVVYFGYHQRRLGCYGAGKRFLFVNSAGEVHACPFCLAGAGNCLEDPLDEVLKRVGRLGCRIYKMAP